MSLAPADWAALIEDQRTQVLVTPFVGFMDLIKDGTFEPALDIDDRLDPTFPPLRCRLAESGGIPRFCRGFADLWC
jgi:hypothetical protein